jgi:shikimate dehydrogenase
MKKVCIIGWPVSHSRSPLIHNYWIRKYAIDAVYEKTEVRPEDVVSFVSGFQAAGWTGCNVTVPHKEAVCAALSNMDSSARRLGAINTLYISDGKLRGTNTDGEGYLASLLQAYPDFDFRGARIVVLGAGGAAKAIIGALSDRGVQTITVHNRSKDRVAALQKQFGPQILPGNPQGNASSNLQCDLFINATSLGMSGQPPLEFNLSGLPQAAIVSDIVYSPLETPLLKLARAQGNRTLGGLGMLLHQAVRGFELWFGVRPEVTSELYELVAADVLKAQA